MTKCYLNTRPELSKLVFVAMIENSSGQQNFTASAVHTGSGKQILPGDFGENANRGTRSPCINYMQYS